MSFDRSLQSHATAVFAPSPGPVPAALARPPLLGSFMDAPNAPVALGALRATSPRLRGARHVEDHLVDARDAKEESS